MRLKTLSIRMYDVGWGDCFLLSCHYAGAKARHILIDFGTTAKSAAEERERLMPIAEDIRERCNGKLDAVIASHRHRDHIGGFAALKRIASPGNIIAALRPELVIQPWTENPAATGHRSSPAHRVQALSGMERFSASLPLLLEESKHEFSVRQRELLLGIAHQNYPNRTAVESLRRLGKSRVYAAAGRRTALDNLLPGFTARVLGPAKSNTIIRRPERLRDFDYETWQKCFFWEVESAAIETHRPSPLFPGAPQWHPAMAPVRMRWFIERVNRLRADQIVSLAKLAHSEINNTSLVIALEGFGHRLLFPGDTEVRGWESVFANRNAEEILQGVTAYKVSHHGAANGTPRSVWDLMQSRDLLTMVSRHKNALESGCAFLDELASSRLVDSARLRAAGRLYADIELEPCAPAAKLVA